MEKKNLNPAKFWVVFLIGSKNFLHMTKAQLRKLIYIRGLVSEVLHSGSILEYFLGDHNT